MCEGAVRIEYAKRPHLAGPERQPLPFELRLRIAEREVLVHREAGFERVSVAFANHADDGGIACRHTRGARAHFALELYGLPFPNVHILILLFISNHI